MSDLEIRGANVEEAIEKGLAQLGLQRSDVIVDVVDEGSRGILGLGAREAVVRLLPMVTRTPPPPPSQPKPPPQPKPTAVVPSTPAPTPPPTAPIITSQSSEALSAERDTAVDVVQTLLHNMHITADINTTITEPDDVTGRQINLIQITGQDLGALIGPRGETLNALQYLVRLLTGHQLRQRVDLIIDIEGYRERRKQALSRLAERMADKAIKQQRPVSLEPMPPNERRVIHMTLRDHDDVQTQSVGEGDNRRVRILPKK